VKVVDPELREFLEKIAINLSKQVDALRQEMLGRFEQVDAHISEVGDNLMTAMNRWSRTRDLRLLALESRLGELEGRMRKFEDQFPPAA